MIAEYLSGFEVQFNSTFLHLKAFGVGHSKLTGYINGFVLFLGHPIFFLLQLCYHTWNVLPREAQLVCVIHKPICRQILQYHMFWAYVVYKVMQGYIIINFGIHVYWWVYGCIADYCSFCLFIAWDQSDAFVKIYATDLSGVSKLPPENVVCQFNSM